MLIREAAHTILFIGNSLTYTNDLPAMVERIGRAMGVRIVTETVAAPNYALEDHLGSLDFSAALRKRKWDFIVLQQGPSSLDASRTLLIRDTKRIRELAPKESHIALLMVWPSRQRAADADRVAASYRAAAEAVGGVCIPAGEAWRHAPKRTLYGEDGFHPSRDGTYLAALTVVQTLAGSLPKDVPEDLRAAIEAATARITPAPAAAAR
ncbi:MAG: SGNH/GDSL hydrolase family protein [Thermoanaerobaculia bacterium]